MAPAAGDIVGARPSPSFAAAQGGAVAADPILVVALSAIVGAAHVHCGFAERLAYARDRLPYATFRVRAGHLPATLPRAIVAPGTTEDVAAVVRLARARGVPVVPYGAGSGVLGGAIPLAQELMIDLKRLNRVIALNEIDGTVTVEAGLNGGQLEAFLNERGWTTGHLPQSLHMSTVGGWAACRGAGQASTRYGKIEDIVLGLKAVMPDGRPLEVRPVARRAVGPSIKDLLIGAEGVLGIVTELTLRVWRRPEAELPAVLAFPSLEAALAAARGIMQAELRPAVVRLYDDEESRQRGAGLPELADRPFLAILMFSGPRRLAEVERALALEIAAAQGAVETSDAPYRHWQSHRYESYSPKWQSTGHYMDTIEITGPWSALPVMYARMRAAARAIHPEVHFGCHWSHVYSEGACQYMTLRLPPMEDEVALDLHRRLWDAVSRLCLELGGSLSHHHGVGLFRGPWLREELNTGLDLIQALKDVIDPGNLMNPGKLGLRAPAAVSPWTANPYD
jgi:alkyldihydroxyacetonephosphate synthase